MASLPTPVSGSWEPARLAAQNSWGTSTGEGLAEEVRLCLGLSMASQTGRPLGEQRGGWGKDAWHEGQQWEPSFLPKGKRKNCPLGATGHPQEISNPQFSFFPA